MSNVIKYNRGIQSLSDLTTEDTKAIRDLYVQMSKKISKEVDRLSSKTNPTVSDHLKKAQLRDLQKSIDKNLKEITESTKKIITTGMTNISANVVNQNNNWLNSIGINVKSSFAHVPQDVVANIMSGKLYANDWEFSKRIWGDYNKSKGDIATIVANGIAENKSTYDIAKDLEKYVTPGARKPWDWNKVYPGVKKEIDYNAQRMARTMINHAYQQSIIEVSKNNPFVSGIQWRAAFTKTTCELCESRNGVIYPVNSVPIDHPNGKCTFIAVINKSYNEIADELADWVNGKENKALDKFAESAGFDIKDFNINKFTAKDSAEKIKSVSDIRSNNDVIKYLKQSNYFMVQYSARDGSVYKNWNDFKIEDFNGVDVNILKSIISGYNTLFGKYPFLKGNIRGFRFSDLDEAKTSYAWTSFTKNASVVINRKCAKNYTDFMESLKSDIKIKWHPAIDNNKLIESVLIHEYGHVMEATYQHYKGTNTAPSISIRKKIMENYGGVSFRSIKDNLSEYATTNSVEWFAEAFSEYVTSDNPRPLAKEFGEYFDKKIAKVIEKKMNEENEYIKNQLEKLTEEIKGGK